MTTDLSRVDAYASATMRDHLVRVMVEEELRIARVDDAWYESHPEDKAFAGGEFYHEHRARLALLERIEKVAK